ncbi:MAG: hypothetical protein WC979_02865 [Candidatus Pacearchaeota archaeon]|jgi:tRNA(Glu) U13 pseudouridine synthase TruD|nr:hypothetical protein [Clostridia bacterium]
MKIINGGAETLILGTCKISNNWREKHTTRIEFIGTKDKNGVNEIYIVLKPYAEVQEFLESDNKILEAIFHKE